MSSEEPSERIGQYPHVPSSSTPVVVDGVRSDAHSEEHKESYEEEQLTLYNRFKSKMKDVTDEVFIENGWKNLLRGVLIGGAIAFLRYQFKIDCECEFHEMCHMQLNGIVKTVVSTAAIYQSFWYIKYGENKDLKVAIMFINGVLVCSYVGKPMLSKASGMLSNDKFKNPLKSVNTMINDNKTQIEKNGSAIKAIMKHLKAVHPNDTRYLPREDL